jgi:hypothetical protein
MTNANIYALFIAINDYEHGSISNLNGCVRDAESMAQWLQQQVSTEKAALSLVKLYSSKNLATPTPLPTRNNICMALRAYAGKLKKEDTFFLFYAGHGGTEIAHPNIQSPTGLLSTLVPCDSGIEKIENGINRPVFDILSIEIRALLYNIWKDTKPTIVFVQDSCHSERGTRQYGSENQIANTVERMVHTSPNRGKVRKIAEFDMLDVTARQMLANVGSGSNAKQLSFDQLTPAAEHVHLAACGFNQSAYETQNPDGTMSGIFTRTLVDLLYLSNGKLSFSDLEQRLRLSIDSNFRQTPNLYVNSPNTNRRYAQFLGQNILKNEHIHNVVRRRKLNQPNEWEYLLDVGALQGLPLMQKDEKRDILLSEITTNTTVKAYIDYVSPSFSVVKLYQPDTLPDTDNLLYFATLPPEYFVSPNNRLRVHIVPPAPDLRTPRLIQLLAENEPTIFRANIGGGKYYLQYKTNPNCLVAYFKIEDKFILYAAFAAVQPTLDSEELFAAKMLRSGVWEYYDDINENVKLCPLPPDWLFMPADGKDYDNYLGAMAYAFEKTEPIHPIGLSLMSDSNFGDFIAAEEFGFLSPYVQWQTDPSNAEYFVNNSNTGFGIYAAPNKPICLSTADTKLADALQIGEYLQKISLYKQRLSIINPHPDRFDAFSDMQFKLHLNFMPAPSLVFPLSLQNPTIKEQIIKLPLQNISLGYSLGFEYNYTGAFDGNNMPPIYVAALMMNYDFEIYAVAFSTPISLSQNKAVPLGLPNNIVIEQHFFEQNKPIKAHIKVFISLKPFDISSLLQYGVPVPNFNKGAEHRETRRYGERACDWLAFSLPLVFDTI